VIPTDRYTARMVGKSRGGFDGLCICVSDSMDLRLAFLLHSIAQVFVEIFLFGWGCKDWRKMGLSMPES